jgi:type IV pilus assembly protein PilN
MIKINLLTVERKAVKKKFSIGDGQKITIGCSALLIAALVFTAWRYWAIRQDSERLDRDIARAQQEAVQLRSLIGQVQQFEQRRAELQQRVTLIEQLRKDQNGPVHMLDQISRSLPPLLWLTDLKQQPNPNEVLVTGKCATLTALTDFVANLEASGYFKRSIEIVSTETQPVVGPPGEIVTFSIRALFQRPGEPAPEPAAAPVGKRG